MNRRILIIIGVVLLVLVLLVVLVSCASGTKKQSRVTSADITLTYWRAVDDKEVFDPIIAQYENEHKNIHIEYKKLTTADYEKNILDELAAGHGPDIFSVQNTWMPRYFNKLAPAPDNILKLSDYEQSFFPVAITDTVKDKKIYGVPYSIDTLAMYVNQALLDKANISDPPDTWEAVVGKAGDPKKPSILGPLNKRQGNTFSQSAIALGNTSVSRASDILALMMLQQRTSMVNSDHDKALFDLTQKVDGSEEHLGTRALKFYTSFADPKTSNYSWNNTLGGDSVKAFSDGKVALMINYAYQAPVIERLNPKLQYTIAPVPQIGGQDPINYASYWTEVVSKSSQHSQEAWDFINFVASKEQLQQYSEASKTVSSRKDVATGGKLEPFYKQNATAIDWYKGDAQQADEIFSTLVTQVLGGEDPQRAVSNAANRETTVLKGLKDAGNG